jgi:hypothetical protein
MKQSIILGIGTGRCGLASLAKILNHQPDAQCSYEDPPLLPWKVAMTPSPPAPLPQTGEGSYGATLPQVGEGNYGAILSQVGEGNCETAARRVVRERFARFRRYGKAQLLGDAASFYLPYLEDAIALEPDIRIVCLKRPREEVAASFCEWLDQAMPLPTNHWALKPAPGWHHDPNRTRTFPQYDIQNREEGIRRYWDEYYQKVGELIGHYPEQIRVFDTHEALNTEGGLRDLLSFAGIPPERQVLAVGTHVDSAPKRTQRQQARLRSDNPMDPRRCAVLVPFATYITPGCERGLQELERRGYTVRRFGGCANIDLGRNRMATNALLDGYEETMWIDSDIDFHPEALDRLRSHRLPVVCGIYPKKGPRDIASSPLPETTKLVFGKEGGLVEILHAGAGFLLVRREVYQAIQERLQLPMCNERFQDRFIPFFLPMVHPWEDTYLYFVDDYAFSQRARDCGFKIMADTTIRLWHMGSHAYGWEDAGIGRERFDTFVMTFGQGSDQAEDDVGDDKQDK